MNKKLARGFKKIVKFWGSSFIGTLADTLVLLLLSHILSNSYIETYIVSPLISFECSVLVNFTISYFFIWKDRVIKRSKKGFFRKFLLYNLSCFGVFMIKMGFLLIIENIFGWHVVICNLVALCFSGGLNFLSNEFLVFRKKRPLSHE